MPETLDMSGLMDRINQVKQYDKNATEFNTEFLHCLMERHDLKNAIPIEFEIDNVPSSIIDDLRDGKIPDTDELLKISTDTQNVLLFELLWVCGLSAIYLNTHDDESEDNDDYFRSIVAMLDVSPAHYMGAYLTSIFTLLLGKVPSPDFIEIITNNFNCSEEQLNKNKFMISELALGVFLRWKEDSIYRN